MNGDTIHPEYSAYLEQIFETKEIAGQKVADLVLANSSLGSDVLDQVNAAIAACIGEDSMNFEFNSHLLVSELDKTMPSGAVKSLELIWSPICNDQDVVDKLMLCVRDVTELKKLAKEAGQQKRELEIIGQILAVNQEKFHEFVDSSGKFISENQHIIRQAGSGGEDKTAETLTLLFRNMHTIKGNARTYGLLHLTNLVHEAEQTYDELRKNPDAQWDAEQLLKQLEEAHTAIAEYARINEVKLGRKGPGRRGSVEKFLMVEKEQVQKALDLLDHVDQSNPAAMSDAVAKVRMTLMLIGTDRMESILSGVTDSLPSLAKELGKEAPDVVINDHGIVIKTQVADLVKNVFMHLYRNSMDHGLETAQVRLAKGKPAQGRIGLNLHLESDQIQMQLQDDGKGLAVGYILKKALEKGLVKEGEHPTPEQIAQFIFAAGFSTADKVTEVSGRGVGMDAVKGFVERESGSIELKFVTDSDAGEDFRHFVTLITLPAKFAVQGPV